MELNIHYLGITTEIANCSKEVYTSKALTFGQLKEELVMRFPKLKDVSFQFAQDHELVNLQDKITGADIALLPPFSGG